MLDQLTLARKEGFARFAHAPVRTAPEQLTRSELSALRDGARAEYDRARRTYHANLGPIRTPQLSELHEDLWDILESNQHDNHVAKGSIALDAFPGLGKTTAVLAFAREFHNRQIEQDGALTDAGHEHWPVCRIGLSGNTGMKDFNRAILEFYGHPARERATTAQMGIKALECALLCATRLLIIDDLHFLSWRSNNGVEISNHFKYVANEFPVTLLYVGVGLAAKGLFSEGASYADAVLAQTGRRTTRLGIEPFHLGDDAGRRAWRGLLLSIEQRLVLADKHPGMLADDLAGYLFARSTGHIGSLMSLVNRGAQRAVRTGAEHLNAALLDRVKIDEAAELARKELAAALACGELRVSAPHGQGS
jgi:hypothetical protein